MVPWLVLGLAAAVAAQKGGSIAEAGNTQVSAMMVCRALDVLPFPFNLLPRCSLETPTRSTS